MNHIKIIEIKETGKTESKPWIFRREILLVEA
jgi:hypothetical protein